MSDRLPHSLKGKISRYSKRVKDHRCMLGFTGRDPISISAFLDSYKTSCYHFRINEGLTKQIFPYVIDGNQKMTVHNNLRQPNITYSKMINFLHTKYDSKDTIRYCSPSTRSTISVNVRTNAHPISQSIFVLEQTTAVAPTRRSTRSKCSYMASHLRFDKPCNGTGFRSHSSISTISHVSETPSTTRPRPTTRITLPVRFHLSGRK